MGSFSICALNRPAFLMLMAALFFFGACAGCPLPAWSPLRPAYAASLGQLQKQLAQEQKKAAERKQTLQRLTQQERELNADLAAAEKRILEIEKGLALQQEKLLELGSADEDLRKEYEVLLAEQGKTEKMQAETLRLLWGLTSKRLAVGSRDMPDWAATDREYAWSRELYAALENYRKELDERENKLAQLLGRREKLSQDMQRRLASVNEEKSRLVKSRIAYDRRLAELRRRRVSEEAELNEIIKLVENLHVELVQRTPVDIAKLKGALPWPVNGKVRLRYAPDAAPATRGIGFAAQEREEVRAIAPGKVVHNDVLRGFGTVLILQHGPDYYSLYAFLGNSPLRVGDAVAGRQKIGAVGYYPAINGPGLYFELRFKQKAINPEQWFAS